MVDTDLRIIHQTPQQTTGVCHRVNNHKLRVIQILSL